MHCNKCNKGNPPKITIYFCIVWFPPKWEIYNDHCFSFYVWKISVPVGLLTSVGWRVLRSSIMCWTTGANKLDCICGFCLVPLLSVMFLSKSNNKWSLIASSSDMTIVTDSATVFGWNVRLQCWIFDQITGPFRTENPGWGSWMVGFSAAKVKNYKDPWGHQLQL